MRVKNYKQWWKAAKQMRDHYKSLMESAVGELRCANMQIEHLYNALDEVETVTHDGLAKVLIRNHKERHNLDKLIHTRQLFPDPERFGDKFKK